MRYIPTLVALSWIGLSVCLAGEPSQLKPDEFEARMAKAPAAQILDVRTQEEFDTGHIAKALVIPWGDADFLARVAKGLDVKKPLFVYCRSGRRSSQAAAALAKLGFPEMYQLNGGILAWQAAGKPVEKR